jgi:hypothetical protein
MALARTLPWSVALFAAGALPLPLGGGDASPAGTPLRPLSRIYLMTHALNWLELTPDNPLRQTATWEQWAGRCEACYQYEFALKDKYYSLMAIPEPTTAVFCLPSGMKGDPPLIDLAGKTFGDRCVVCRLGSSPQAEREALGAEFVCGLEADRARAEALRGKALSEGEIGAWERSKAWALDLRSQLEARGYTFDPATVEVIAFGEDWSGCAATYPIHMGRAWGLARPVERRFDLINPDCTPVLLTSIPLQQSLPLAENVRLFVFRTAEGRFLGQYWEGLHGLYDVPHRVDVSFPPASARLVDGFGKPRGDELGGQLTLQAGCGGHTPYRADLVMSEPGVPAEVFQAALMAGTVGAAGGRP